MKWWAYIHSNGSLQVKRFFSEIDLEEAEQSPFVKRVIQPFEAKNRDDAYSIATKIRNGNGGNNG